jgi:hypothetical protein
MWRSQNWEPVRQVLKRHFFELSPVDQGEFWKQVGMHRRAWTPASLSFHDKDHGFEGD